MNIVIIAAHDEHLLIGKDGKIPWHYPEDLRHFKRRTMGHPVVMGRKTYESIGSKPLPGRTNVVISRTLRDNDVRVYHSLEQALGELEEEDHEMIFIAGGSEIYRQSMPLADFLNITLIHHTWKGDVYFPEYRDQIGGVWEETNRQDFEEFSFLDYKRIT